MARTVQWRGRRPNAKAHSLESTDFVTAIAPTPIFTAAQAHIPAHCAIPITPTGVRASGLPGAPMATTSTVLRGGWGRFIESPLGFSLVSGWAVACQLRGVLQSGLPVRRCHAVVSIRQSLQHLRRQCVRHGGLLLRVSHPLQGTLRPAVEPDLRAGLRPQHWHAALLHRQPRQESRDHGRPEPGPANTIGYNNTDTASASGACITTMARSSPITALSLLERHPERRERWPKATTTAGLSRFHSTAAKASPSTPATCSRAISRMPAGHAQRFCDAGGNFVTDRFHPGLDYGNVIYDRKHRFLAPTCTTCPSAKASGGSHRLARLTARWETGNWAALPSCNRAVPYALSGIFRSGRYQHSHHRGPDSRRSSSPAAPLRSAPHTTQWLNPDAFCDLNLQDPDARHRSFRKCACRQRRRTRTADLFAFASEGHRFS